MDEARYRAAERPGGRDREALAEVFGEDGGHAGENENAFMMAIDPSLVHKERYSPDMASANPTPNTWSAYPAPSSIGLYKAGEGYPTFNLAKAKEFLAKSPHPQGGVEIEYVYVTGLEEERKMWLVLIDNLRPLNVTVKMVPLTWPNMVARGSKVETSPEMLAVFTTPVSTDPDAVAYQYHKGSWGKYYGSHFYENKDVWGLVERARSIAKWEERAPIYAEIQKRVTADAPEIFGMLANRRWGFASKRVVTALELRLLAYYKRNPLERAGLDVVRDIYARQASLLAILFRGATPILFSPGELLTLYHQARVMRDHGGAFAEVGAFRGDSAEVAQIELVGSEYNPRAAQDKEKAQKEAEETLSAVVRVKSRIVKDARSAETLGLQREGSGVLIREGFILTIGYLVIEAESVEVIGADGTAVPATVAGYDHASGFGVLRLLAPLAGKPLPLGDASALAEREAAKRALEAAERRALTFKQATEQYFTTKKRDELRGEDSRRGWLRALELHAQLQQSLQDDATLVVLDEAMAQLEFQREIASGLSQLYAAEFCMNSYDGAGFAHLGRGARLGVLGAAQGARVGPGSRGPFATRGRRLSGRGSGDAGGSGGTGALRHVHGRSAAGAVAAAGWRDIAAGCVARRVGGAPHHAARPANSRAALGGPLHGARRCRRSRGPSRLLLRARRGPAGRRADGGWRAGADGARGAGPAGARGPGPARRQRFPAGRERGAHAGPPGRPSRRPHCGADTGGGTGLG